MQDAELSVVHGEAGYELDRHEATLLPAIASGQSTGDSAAHQDVIQVPAGVEHRGNYQRHVRMLGSVDMPSVQGLDSTQRSTTLRSADSMSAGSISW